MDIYVILYKPKTEIGKFSNEPNVYTTKEYKDALNQAIDLTANPDSKLYSITELDYHNPYSDRFPGMRRMYLQIDNGNFKLNYREEITQAKE